VRAGIGGTAIGARAGAPAHQRLAAIGQGRVIVQIGAMDQFPDHQRHQDMRHEDGNLVDHRGAPPAIAAGNSAAGLTPR